MYIPLFAAVSQIARPHNPSLIRVCAQDEMNKEVFSVDVSNSTDAEYSGMTLSIKTNATFNQSRMYYLEADQGVCGCVVVLCVVSYVCVVCVVCGVVCVCVCVCVWCVCVWCRVCVCFVWCHVCVWCVCVGSSDVLT